MPSTQTLIIVACLVLGVSLLLASWIKKSIAREEQAKAQAIQLEAQKKAATELDKQERERRAIAESIRATADLRAMQDKREELLNVLYEALYDKYSMRLRNLRIVRGGGGDALCGDISAKLPSGRYFQERAFAVTDLPLENTTTRVIGVPRGEKSVDAAVEREQLAAAGC
jgi:hypothetical protein